MMLLSLATLLLAQSTDGLTFETPKEWTRQEEPQKRYVLLTPPNLPAGKECGVLIFPPEDVAVDLSQYLEHLVKNATGTSQKVGETQTRTIGSFQVLIWSQKSPLGATQHLALHAVKWGNRGQSVLYLGNDLEVFKAQAPDVITMMTKVVVPKVADAPAAGGPTPLGAGTVVISGLTIPLPAGWTRSEDPSGWTLLGPPAPLQSGKPVVMVSATRKIQGSHWKAHRDLVKSMTEQAKWPGSYVEAQTLGPGPFIVSTASCFGDARAVRVYTAVAGDQMEVIAVSPLGGAEFSREFTAILEKVTLKNAPAEKPKRPDVVEAFRRPLVKKYFTPDGTFFYGKLSYDRILLLSNGVADFKSSYAEGYDAFPQLWKIDAESETGVYGGWKEDGKTVKIRRDSKGAGEVYERENGNLRFGDQVWTPIPKVDGLKLKGRYAYKSKPGIGVPFNHWIEFTEEGGFKAGDLLTWLAEGDLTGRPKPPETAEGTYELRNWTIWFKIDDKPVWSADFQTLKDDPKDPDGVLIGTHPFTKE
jgi:hypothetical protein